MPQILIAEDDTDLRELLGFHMQRLGHEAELTDDGPRAVALASRGQFDLVMVDFHLRSMDGADVARSIRALAGYASVPILLLTASASRWDVERAIAAGVDVCLRKPLKIAPLASAVARLLPG